MQKKLNNPLPSSLYSRCPTSHGCRLRLINDPSGLDECKKAEKILNSFVKPPKWSKSKSKLEEPELGIPRAILSGAKVRKWSLRVKNRIIANISCSNRP